MIRQKRDVFERGIGFDIVIGASFLLGIHRLRQQCVEPKSFRKMKHWLYSAKKFRKILIEILLHNDYYLRGGSMIEAGRKRCSRSMRAPRDTCPLPCHRAISRSSSPLEHIIKPESSWTRATLCPRGVNSWRRTFNASITRPSSRHSRYFCSWRRNFISTKFWGQTKTFFNSLKSMSALFQSPSITCWQNLAAAGWSRRHPDSCIRTSALRLHCNK